MKSTMTIREAVAQVDTYMEDTRAALGSNAQLTDDFRKDGMACDSPDGPSGQVFATRDAEVVKVEGENKEAVFDSIRAWWKRNNFRETDSESEILYARNPSNGFRMTVEITLSGKYYVGFSSPCVWPNGNPESEG